uniref:ubiquitin carboxyl-terminal hydrolase 7-like isoform X1 n=1 Tax=Solea senegalensis TaxID=28829 RepID=UPI001CD87049|nr:ubiquitin carboxyl-terminal hydrolase 7-like isoform X1 [Solea senegalensis]
MSDLQIDKHFVSGSFGRSARVKYHGLFNQGGTCYLNSVLQVLFMTRHFREAVERYASKNSENEHIDHGLKALFDDLKRRCANTSKIKRKLGIDKAYEERDAAEYFEKILSLASRDASQIFHGELTHQTRCSKCAKKTNANGHFWHLPLELVDSNAKSCSVVDSIDQYFQTSHFNGENQMYCDKCDSKSDATINCQMKHHPEVLTLLLKRFDYDYSCRRHVKNDCIVDVPFVLQIPKNQMYELFAVVEHFGDLRSGHYTATIKSQDDERWYNFDDNSVKLLDYQPFQTDKTEKYHNAYLLFYRKKTTDMQDTRQMFTDKGLPSDTGRNANIKPKYDEKGMKEKTVLFLVEPRHEVVKRKGDKTRHVSLERKKRSEGDEPSRKRTSSARYSVWDEKHQNKPGLDSEEAGQWKNRQGSEIQTVHEDIKRGDVKHGTGTKTSAIKSRHSKKYDSYHDSHGEERSGHRQQNMSTNDPRGKQRGSKMLAKNKIEERREVKGEKEQKWEDEEPAQSKKRKMNNHMQEDEKEALGIQLAGMNINTTEMVPCTKKARTVVTEKMRSWWRERFIGCFSFWRKKRKNADKKRRR